MTITRIIDGKSIEIELTDHEMWKAYDEVEHKIDIETVDFYGTVGDGDSPIPDDKIDEVANRYRNMYGKYLENDSDVRYEFVCDAIREVIGDDN